MQTGIYAILDIIANMIVGGLYMHKHDAVAIRFFNDVASQGDSLISKHPQDFDLICLGTLEEDNTITPVGEEYRTILTGKQWLALQKKEVPEPQPINDRPAARHLQAR